MGGRNEMGTLPLDELTLGEEVGFSNPREDQGDIKGLAASITQHGLLYPLTIWKVKIKNRTHNVVTDGGRRLRAIRLLVDKKKFNGLADAIPVTYLTGVTDQNDARKKSLVANVQRRDLASYEIAKEIDGIIKLGDAQKDVAKSLGKSETWVSRIMKAWKSATPAVKKAWEAQKLPDDDVQSIIKLKPDEQDAMLKKVLKAREAGGKSNGKASRKARGKARAAAKGGDRTKKPGVEKVRRYAEVLKTATKPTKYIQGMLDMAKFMMGELSPGAFDKEWTEFAKKQGFYKTSDKKSK